MSSDTVILFEMWNDSLDQLERIVVALDDCGDLRQATRATSEAWREISSMVCRAASSGELAQAEIQPRRRWLEIQHQFLELADVPRQVEQELDHLLRQAMDAEASAFTTFVDAFNLDRSPAGAIELSP